MIFLRAGFSCLATTEGEGLGGESWPEIFLKCLMRKIFSSSPSNLDVEVRSSGDVSIVERTNSVEWSSLGECEEQTETSQEQNLVRKVVVSQTWPRYILGPNGTLGTLVIHISAEGISFLFE